MGEENSLTCSHVSFFEYCEAVGLSDVSTLVWQNFSLIKETSIEAIFDFFTGRNFWQQSIFSGYINDFFAHCPIPDGFFDPCDETLNKNCVAIETPYVL